VFYSVILTGISRCILLFDLSCLNGNWNHRYILQVLQGVVPIAPGTLPAPTTTVAAAADTSTRHDKLS